MNRTMLVIVATLLAVPLLSGCLGGDEAPKAKDDGDCPQDICGDDKVLDDTTGCIAGVVQNEMFAPVEGAEVKLRELDVTDYTDAEGRYSFCKLAPGVYNIFIAAAGHDPGTKEVTVVAGEEVSGDVSITTLPPAATPLMVGPTEHIGYMGCAIANSNTFRGDTCSNVQNTRVGNQQPLKNENNRNNFYPPMLAGITAMAVGIDGEVPPPGSYPATLTYRVWWDNPPGAVIPDVIGPDGHSEVLVFEPADWQKDPRGYDRDNGDGTSTPTDPAHVTVELAQISSPQFTANHKFTLYLTFFYHGHPVPSGYSALPDA